MSSFKKLSKADVTTVNYHANKQWILNYPSSSINNDPNLRIYTGTYITGTFYSNNVSVDPYTGGQYERLIYDSMNHLFYQNYTNLLNTGSLMFDIDTYQSASQQRPTASYFDYNANPLFINQFPTGAGASIRVLSINQDLYGSKILPNSFKLTSSVYRIKDDGNGNLYDIAGSDDDYIDLNYLTLAFVNGYFDDLTPGISASLIGNIFYAHGIAVITNSDYQDIFPYPPLASNDTASFFPTDSPKTITILSNDIPRTGTLNTSSVALSGSNAAYYTVNADGTLTLNTTTPGNYNVYYTVNNTFNNGTGSLTSNPALISVNVNALQFNARVTTTEGNIITAVYGGPSITLASGYSYPATATSQVYGYLNGGYSGTVKVDITTAGINRVLYLEINGTVTASQSIPTPSVLTVTFSGVSWNATDSVRIRLGT